jgi:hypothetical protein
MTGRVLGSECWDGQHINILQLPVFWMLCIKLSVDRCIFVWNDFMVCGRGHVPVSLMQQHSCLSGILVWCSIQRQLNVITLNVKYSCIVWVPTLCFSLQYRTASSLTALCRVYWDLWWGHSLWIEDTAVREKASYCVSHAWRQTETAATKPEISGCIIETRTSKKRDIFTVNVTTSIREFS